MSYVPKPFSEDAEQIKVVNELTARGIPFWHTNNEWFSTSVKQKVRSKAMGVQSGIPDLFVCFPGQLVGIEMKRKDGGTVSSNQKKWAYIIEQCKIPVWVAHGYDEAMEIIAKYEPLGKVLIPDVRNLKTRKNPEDIF